MMCPNHLIKVSVEIGHFNLVSDNESLFYTLHLLLVRFQNYCFSFTIALAKLNFELSEMSKLAP